ncbi:O-methyltransferase glim-like protein, partial [Polyplosphaeria fusca]
LPDKKIFGLASEALDILSEIQLSLEPAPQILADHFLGYTNTKCLVAAVDLKIPDILSSGPATLSSLASSSNTRADRLGQIMRALYNNGIFTYDSSAATYSNNHVSTLLRSDHWTQWRAWVQLYGNEFYDMARGIPASVQKSATRTPAQIEYDTDDSMFKYFTEQGWIAKFHATLGAGAIAMAPGILEDYPWEEMAGKTILDVGGGGGGLIALLLRKHKTIQGAVLDMPKVIEQAKMNFHGAEGQYKDVAEQIPEENLMVGDFMTEVPSFEVYTMKWCLHDWDDEKACTILRNIRRAIKKGGHSRLVVLESVLSDGHMGRMSRYADANMMVAVGGQERSEAQWKKLASQTGWTVNKICTLRNAWPCAIEFLPS